MGSTEATEKGLDFIINRMDALEGFHRKNEWHDLMYVDKVPKLGGDYEREEEKQRRNHWR